MGDSLRGDKKNLWNRIIEVPDINDIHVRRGKSKRISERVTCLHHFQIELATFYPIEFSSNVMKFLGHRLNSYICDLPYDDRFKDLKGVDELAKIMVETNKHKLYPYVYLLLKLTLILPVATASVERAFSSMKYVKNDLR
ncbi:hypothetical protein LINGRAHAP2_LOCUS11419, partial [Linum grandiflorum]